MQYSLEEYGKISSIKTQTNRSLGRSEALVCYKTAEEAKVALADISMDQGWTAEMCRSTGKDEQIRVNECYREEQIKRSQQKEKENTNTNGDNVTSLTKQEIETEIERKGQLQITRNKSNEIKEIDENKEKTR